MFTFKLTKLNLYSNNPTTGNLKMDMKSLAKQIIFALQLESPTEVQKTPVQQLLTFLEKLHSEGAEKVNPTLVGKLNTLRREIADSGLNSERSAMLIKEIVSTVGPKYDWPNLMGTIKGVKLGQILDAAGAGLNAGKSMLRKITDGPTLSMSEVTKIVFDKRNQTLTYLNGQGEPLFIVKGYAPSEAKVEIRKGEAE